MPPHCTYQILDSAAWPDEKLCDRCGVVYPLADFHKDRSRADGLAAYCKACVQAYCAANATLLRARAAQWQREHSTQAAVHGKRWHRTHIEQSRAMWRRAASHRKARIARVGGRFTAQDVAALYDVQAGCCAYCGTPLLTFHIEHKMPIARGGTNGVANLCLACPPCNLRKGTLSDEEFRALLADG